MTRKEELVSKDLKNLPAPLRWIVPEKTVNSAGLILARTVALFVMSFAISANTSSVTTVGHTLQSAQCDFLLILNLECGSGKAVHGPPSIPLLRDYASLFHMYMIASLSVLIGPLIQGYSSLVADLRRTGAITRRSKARSCALAAKASARIVHPITNILILSCSLSLGIVALASYKRDGVYSILSPGAIGREGMIYYANWWISKSDIGKAWFVLVATLGAYLLIWNLYVMLEGYIHLSMVAKDAELRLIAHQSHAYYGWSPIAELVRLGSRTLLLTLVGLFSIGVIANFRGWFFLSAFPLMYVVSCVPVLLANNDYRKARTNHAFLGNYPQEIKYQIRVLLQALPRT